MTTDLSPIFARYEHLRAQVDALFAKVQQSHPDCVTCTEGCSDCCHALFDLSLVEAMVLNKAFNDTFTHSRERSEILEYAAEMDRSLARIKRDFHRANRDGTPPEEIMESAGRIRMRCPLLTQENTCALYHARPITCRIYGIPTAIMGKGHVCGKAAFTKGTPYPTVALDKIQDQLLGLSQEIADTINTRFKELAQVYVPLSMALLTTYDNAYLGIGPAPKED